MTLNAEVFMNDLCLHKSTLPLFIKEITAIANSTDKPLRVTLKQWREKRSIDQNSLSHMWYSEIAEQASKRDGNYKFTLDEVKMKLKEMFLGYEKVSVKDLETGETRTEQRLRKTSELDIGDMYFYLCRVEAWAINNGFRLTIPKKCQFRELRERETA